LLRQFSTFALIGGLATATQYVILVVLVRAGMAAPTASAIGFALSATLNYWCNYRFTFRSRQQHAVTAMRFILVALVGLALNSLIVYGLVAIGWHYLLAQVCATATVLVFNFAGNRIWTFGRANDPAPSDVSARRWLQAHATPDEVLIVEDVEGRAPSLLAHSGLRTGGQRTFSMSDDPAVLDRLLAGVGPPILLVLHSPLEKWPAIARACGTIEFANADYRIVRLPRGSP
jgi:putative flippase GtrA